MNQIKVSQRVVAVDAEGADLYPLPVHPTLQYYGESYAEAIRRGLTGVRATPGRAYTVYWLAKPWQGAVVCDGTRAVIYDSADELDFGEWDRDLSGPDSFCARVEG